jgi:DoxX-like family
VAEAFTRLGFPAYFRVELSWAKLLGVVLLLAPVSARLKEWAYAGFAINLLSALIAHLAVGDGPEAWGWAAATGVLWALSYYFWRRRPPRRAPDGQEAGIGTGQRHQPEESENNDDDEEEPPHERKGRRRCLPADQCENPGAK